MKVIGKLTAAQIDRDRISGDGFERNRYSGVKRLVVPGNVVGKTVSRRHDAAVLSVSVIRALVQRIPGERDPIFYLLPIDGVPP